MAAFHGMKFRRPIPDPINQDPVSLAVAEDQPLARRLGRLGVAATERGHGLEFCQEVSELLWDGSVSGWDQGTHLADAAARAGLDLSELGDTIVADPESYEARLDQNDRAYVLLATGVFPLWCSRANRSSARIGSRCSCGA